MFSKMKPQVLPFVISQLLSVALCLTWDSCPDRSVQDIRAQGQTQHEIALVFYYVSWSSESIDALAVFKQLEHKYNAHINFASVDCYHLNCNCSRINGGGSRLSHSNWPTLVVYYGNRYYLSYNGDWSSSNLFRFVDLLLKPIQRLNGEAELQDFYMQNEVVVLAVIPDIMANITYYHNYILAAYKFLEADPHHSFAFALTTKNNAGLLHEEDKQSQIHVLYGHNQANKTVETFNDVWKPNTILNWLQPLWNRFFGELVSYSSAQTLSMHMTKGPVLSLLVPNKSKWYMPLLQSNHTLYREFVPNILQIYRRKCLNINYALQLRYGELLLMQALYMNTQQQDQLFNSLSGNLQPDADKLLPSTLKGRTKLYILTAKYLKTAIANISTAKNKTVSFLLLDGEIREQFLKKHCMNLTERHITAFIMDGEFESMFIMQQQYTFHNLLHFVTDYYDNKLTRHNPNCAVNAIRVDNSSYVTFVHDYNRNMFLDILKNSSNKIIIALFYAPNCAFSGVMLQSLQQITALLNSKYKEAIKHVPVQFIKMNMHLHSLPWEFNLQHTPTLIAFPRGLATESLIFPTNLRANVRNIFAFIVAQLNPVEQIHLSLRACRNTLEYTRLKSCLQFVQELVIHHIGNHLKYWQMYENERSVILQHLNEFKSVNMQLPRFMAL